mmetsp:Transcript_7302/g.19039  ORF Transcript_7302/g.19039 Transcript_7302/m.19039 type:complete len:86 (-) Transcript_7302:453-710(-)
MPLTERAFEALLKIIKASRRPLTLKLRRPPRRLSKAHSTTSTTTTTSTAKVVERQRSATDQSSDDAALSWHHFIQKHANEALTAR